MHGLFTCVKCPILGESTLPHNFTPDKVDPLSQAVSARKMRPDGPEGQHLESVGNMGRVVRRQQRCFDLGNRHDFNVHLQHIYTWSTSLSHGRIIPGAECKRCLATAPRCLLL